MSLAEEQREEIGACAECMAAVCSICGHEPCPVCVDCCDDYNCIVWKRGGGKKGHVCVFVRCSVHSTHHVE